MNTCLQYRAVLPLLASGLLLAGCRTARHDLVLTHVGDLDNRAVASYLHVWSDFVFQTPPADATVAVLQPLPADRAAAYAGSMVPRTDQGSQADDQAASGIGSKANTAGLAAGANTGSLASGADTADLTAGDSAAELAAGAKAGGQTMAAKTGDLASTDKAGDLTTAAKTGDLASTEKAGDSTTADKAGDLTTAANTGGTATGSKAGAQTDTAVGGGLNSGVQAGGSRLTDQSGRAASAAVSGDQETVVFGTHQRQQTQSSRLGSNDLASSSRAGVDAARVRDQALSHHGAADDHASHLRTQAVAPMLTLTKTAVERRVLAGQTVTFVLILRNAGELELESIAIHEYLPDNCAFIRAEAVGRRLKVTDGGRNLLLGGTMAPGDSCELRVIVRALAR